MSVLGSAFSAAGRTLSSPVALVGVGFLGLASLAFIPVGLFIGAVACLACVCDDSTYYRPQRVVVDRPYNSWWSMGSWFDRPWFNTAPMPAYTGRTHHHHHHQPRHPHVEPTRAWPGSQPAAPYSAPTGHGSWFGGGQHVSRGPSYGGHHHGPAMPSTGPSAPSMGQHVG